MPFPREDHQTNTVEEAAAFEQWRGQAYDEPDGPMPYEYAEDER